MRNSTKLGLTVMLASSISSNLDAQQSSSNPKDLDYNSNIIHIILDDMGNEIPGYRGDPNAANTPNIDGLASRGIRFDNFYTSPLCSPTRASILTGKYSFRHGIGKHIKSSESNGVFLKNEEVTLPEVLKSRGYFNVALGKWHLSDLSAPNGILEHPIDTGFDIFMGTPANLKGSRGEDYENYWKNIQVRNGGGSFNFVTNKYITTDTIDDAINVVNNVPQPYFLWLALNAPHRVDGASEPFPLPPRHLYTGNPITVPERMRAIVEAADNEIGRFLSHVDLSNTVVFLYSDNGTYNGAINSPNLLPNHGKGTVYQGGVNCPLIVVGPSELIKNPGRNFDGFVNCQDLFATTVQVAGVNEDLSNLTNSAVDSVSFANVLLNPMAVHERYNSFSEKFDNIRGPWMDHASTILDESGFKLIETLPRFYIGSPTYQLYNLPVDPLERTNLISNMSPFEKMVFDGLKLKLHKIRQ
jgi:arylsulfatase B